MKGAVARELKRKTPFSSPEQAILVGLGVAAARTTESLARFLKTADLTPNQYNVLRILRGSHPHRLACSEIGERMINRDPDITRLVDRLERRGLVERVRSRKDRRVVEVGISARGLEVLRNLDAPVQRMPKALLGHLGAARLRQLADLLDAVIGDMGTFA